MEKYTKDWIDYFYYIGIMNSETITTFTNIFDTAVQEPSKGNIDNVLKKSLGQYLGKLTQDESFVIASNIIDRFNCNRIKIMNRPFLRCVDIYAKYKNNIYYYFNLWKLYLDVSGSNNYTNDNDNNDNINDINDNHNHNHNHNHNDNTESGNNIQIVIENNNTNQEPLTKQYDAIRKGKKQNQKKDDFILRQELFWEKLSKKRKNYIVENDKLTQEWCTFAPKLCTKRKEEITKRSMNMTSFNTYEKWYQDSTWRYYKQSIKKENELKSIKQQSNWKSSSKWSRSIKTPNPSEKWYNDYKAIQYKKCKLQKEFDLKDGVTFKPEVNRTFASNKLFITPNTIEVPYAQDNKSNYLNTLEN